MQISYKNLEAKNGVVAMLDKLPKLSIPTRQKTKTKNPKNQTKQQQQNKTKQNNKNNNNKTKQKNRALKTRNHRSLMSF